MPPSDSRVPLAHPLVDGGSLRRQHLFGARVLTRGHVIRQPLHVRAVRHVALLRITQEHANERSDGPGPIEIAARGATDGHEHDVCERALDDLDHPDAHAPLRLPFITRLERLDRLHHPGEPDLRALARRRERIALVHTAARSRDARRPGDSDDESKRRQRAPIHPLSVSRSDQRAGGA
ncbi:hypothetical protein [Sandaracinus amylolyticus]|uniref:hypothetical protein n=1 Tax=Sandaracinus amylolyticus TaxID=927083 RepID=UPI001F214D63|nr:hypothetical protein [Sandaracinus amylolyticus]